MDEVMRVERARAFAAGEAAVPIPMAQHACESGRHGTPLGTEPDRAAECVGDEGLQGAVTHQPAHGFGATVTSPRAITAAAVSGM